MDIEYIAFINENLADIYIIKKDETAAKNCLNVALQYHTIKKQDKVPKFKSLEV